MLAIVLLLPATYSIVGADTATREVGGAGTSCVGAFSVYNIYGSAPDHGVMHAQAYFNRQARDRAVELLLLDRAPSEIMDEITSTTFDASPEIRQYAIVDLAGRSARFTGSGASDFAGDLGGTSGTFAYAAQGNIISGRGVLERAGAAFESGGGCDLAERLLLALEAGAENGEGDTRCTPMGIPSDGAFLAVDRPGGSHVLLRVEDSAPDNPITLLREQFDVWRIDHPCPSVQEPDAGDSTPDAIDLLDSAVVLPDASSADAGRSMMSTRSSESGCGCSSAGNGEVAIFALLLVLAARVRH